MFSARTTTYVLFGAILVAWAPQTVRGATYFSTDFSGATVPANLEENESPMNPTVTYGGQATWGNVDARSYLRTTDSDYTTVDFTAEVNVTTVSGAGAWGVAWFGFSNAVEASYQEPGPTNRRHTIVVGNDTSWQAGNITLRSALGDSDGIGSITVGTHRLRMTHLADTGGPGTVRFQVDKDYTGGTFFADWTSVAYDVSTIGLDNTNSKVMFGGGRAISYDDFAVAAPPSAPLPPGGSILNVNIGDTPQDDYTGQGHIPDPGNDTWNNFTPGNVFSGSALSFSDAEGSPMVYSDNGAATGINVQVSNATFLGYANDGQLNTSWLFTPGGGTGTILISGLRPDLMYDLAVLGGRHDQTQAVTRVTLGGEDLDLSAGGTPWGIFEDVSPDDFGVVSFTFANLSDDPWNQGYVAAFQVQASNIIPEPSTLAIWALGMLGLALCGRRRRKR
jgi:hypothetical protein